MDKTPSAGALAEGYAIAKGWDRHALLAEFKARNENTELGDVDAAWLGFCRTRGVEPTARPHKITGDYDPRDRPGVVVTNRDVQWAHWMEHLVMHGQDELRDLAEAAGRIMATSRWPKPDSPLPMVRVTTAGEAA